MAKTNRISGQGPISKNLRTQDYGVEMHLPATKKQNPTSNQRPWWDIRAFLEYIDRRRRRLGVKFSRGRSRKSQGQPQVPVGSETSAVPLLHSPITSESKLRSLQTDGRTTELPLVTTRPHIGSVLADAVFTAEPAHTELESDEQEHGIATSLPKTALMVGRRAQQRKGAEAAHLHEAGPYPPSTQEEAKTTPSPKVNHESRQASVESGMSDPRYSSRTDSLGPGYVPPAPPTGCNEFASSAVNVKEPSGKVEAVKLFYDTMSTDNWTSENFVKAFGFHKRPILPDDLNTYETVKGDYTPTHYIEIDLQDKSRGMKEFAKMSLNVSPSMDGIGLVAGVNFMRKHRIKIDVTAHRDSYVTTSRKAGATAREAQRKLLEKAKAEYNLAKELSASTVGPSTQQSKVSSQEKLLAASSRTSTSSDIKSNVFKT